MCYFFTHYYGSTQRRNAILLFAPFINEINKNSDPLCPVTLFNMFTKAKNPSDIRVYVLQQNDPEVDVNCLDKYCGAYGIVE